MNNKINIPLLFVFSIIAVIFSCTREWDNPFETDEDLNHSPNIARIDLDSDNNAKIILDHTYTDSCAIILERNSIGGFEPISYIKESHITLIDTSFDKEINNDFVYRVYITKDQYRTSYSGEMQLIYTSEGLNKPQDLLAVSVEMQGIRLEWKDKSNYEESYIIEKDEGNGFVEIASLPSNSESYFDEISGFQEPSLQLEYRVKAIKTDLESDWADISTTYAGIGSPTDLIITNTSPSNFRIEWQDNSQTETGYSIERKKDAESFIEIAEVGADTSFYSDVISETGIYHYRVRAYKDGDYSVFSNEVSDEITSLFPTDGLVAYYPFNGNANDESWNGNDGMVNGATLTNDRFNDSGKSYNFNGSYISVPHSPTISFEVNDPLTISIWIYRTQNSIPMHIMGKRTSCYSNSMNYQLAIGYENTMDGGIPVPLNKWFHVCCVCTGDHIKIYFNNEIRYNESGALLPPNGAELKIGNSDSCPSPWIGDLDDIRIYNRALTESEIQALYHEGGWGN